MSKLLLKLVLLFRPFWKSLGVQTKHMEVILETKLKMDGRKSPTLSQSWSNKKNGNTDAITSAYFFFMGALFLVLLFSVDDPVSGIAIFQTVWIVLLSLTLISDFTDVLIDVRDNYILLPRPVNDRTLAVSRLLHIFLYLFKLVVPFILPAFIYFIVKHGILASLLFLIQSILAVFITIFFVNILYFTILKYTNQQKFKEIINYFQIGFVIVIMTAYYILPNLIDLDNLTDFNIMETSWGYFLPGTWLANFWAVLIDGNFSMTSILMAGLGLLAPILALYFITKGLSQNFSQKLISIGQGSAGTSTEQKTEKSGLRSWWGSWMTKAGTERAGFDMSWLMTARSRDYKLKTYPLFGFIPAIFIYLALDGDGSLAERWAALADGDQYLMLIYICIYGTFIPVLNLQYSEKFKAAWLFHALPIRQPGILLRGAVKSMIARFVIPIFIVSAVFVLSIWGLKTIDDVLIGFINVLFIAALGGRMLLKGAPFSQSWATQSKGNNIFWSFAMMFILGGLGFLHWIMTDYMIVLIAWGAVAMMLTWWAFRSYKGLRFN